jgi:hypothetical protein
MFKLIGLIIAIIGIGLGAYVGIVVLFAGGLIELISGIKNNFEVTTMVWGIVKMIFCELGGVIAWLGITIGALIGCLDN